MRPPAQSPDQRVAMGCRCNCGCCQKESAAQNAAAHVRRDCFGGNQVFTAVSFQHYPRRFLAAPDKRPRVPAPHKHFAEVSCLSHFVTIMNLLLLGRGKTGSLVADVARERKHHVRVAGATENANCAAVTEEKLRDT